jgi:glycosyltransferase A (GT-A) superfamily protein (DUF2064 family)
MDLLVVAKSPVPGRAKTRLCPPCSPTEAAAVAEVALADTLAAAVASTADRVLLALDGPIGPWCPPGIVRFAQCKGPLDRRIGHAWSLAGPGPILQIGMDTPQVGTSGLDTAMATLEIDGVDAVFGPATDGGWWTVGMRTPAPAAFVGVPTSRDDTGRRQRQRLVALGLRIVDLWAVRDLDTWDDVVAAGYDVRTGVAA